MAAAAAQAATVAKKRELFKLPPAAAAVGPVFAAATDESPEEVSATGHDRIIRLTRENVGGNGLGPFPR